MTVKAGKGIKKCFQNERQCAIIFRGKYRNGDFGKVALYVSIYPVGRTECRCGPTEFNQVGGEEMKHIKTLNTQTLNHTVKKGGCGECQTSCQSACKTSCTVGNQTCEQKK